MMMVFLVKWCVVIMLIFVVMSDGWFMWKFCSCKFVWLMSVNVRTAIGNSGKRENDRMSLILFMMSFCKYMDVSVFIVLFFKLCLCVLFVFIVGFVGGKSNFAWRTYGAMVRGMDLINLLCKLMNVGVKLIFNECMMGKLFNFCICLCICNLSVFWVFWCCLGMVNTIGRFVLLFVWLICVLCMWMVFLNLELFVSIFIVILFMCLYSNFLCLWIVFILI